MIQPETWVRNSFEVEAIRITSENIEDVAEWCGGEVLRSLSNPLKRYVYFCSTMYNKTRQAKAYTGDWIILIDENFRHYRHKSFVESHHKRVADIVGAIQAILMDRLQGTTDLNLKALDRYTLGLAEEICANVGGVSYR